MVWIMHRTKEDTSVNTDPAELLGLEPVSLMIKRRGLSWLAQ